MLKTRLIPVLLLQKGLLVRSELFKIHQVIGNPINEVERFNEWNVDELIYLDITKDGVYHESRKDIKHSQSMTDLLVILEHVSKTCFMPLTWGGGIRNIKDMRDRFTRGADKISLNTAACYNPELISEGVNRFGSQAIVISIDVYCHESDRYEVYTNGGKEPTRKGPKVWAREVENRGAGEILLQSINRDGTGEGYDLDLICQVANEVAIPVIACSGVGSFDDYAKAIRAGATAAAAANIWHFKEMTDRNGKRAMLRAGIDVRL